MSISEVQWIDESAQDGETIRTRFHEWILNPMYPCLGARSALRAGGYEFNLYGNMGESADTERLACDLSKFVKGRGSLPGKYKTFVAAFRGPQILDELQYENLFWGQLQKLHRLDRELWDPSVSQDPESVEFDFSFHGYAFFVVGINPASSRTARRFSLPVMVFNGHDQFVSLQREGKWDSFQGAIRQRDIKLQGSVNPNLGHYGVASNALQYSGRRVDSDWSCPFRLDSESK
ncbi:guanitoxin biosynthesis heme-dependent pre-guanitoxin N-hydroxylase GntA [Streptomyces avermitilis]|uniref:guanitoxin biosynthesis heme-dependent pre-guanitoxin N-hydroxylase GntA n=1 Tax=Streptomyces avermitilis TaxID=33903 RepID=UPI0038275379